MKNSITYFLLTFSLFFPSCKKAVFDHITEGAGGILIGVRINTNPSIVVTGLSTSINEGSSITFNVRFSSSVSNETITISDSLSKFTISPNTINFSSSDSTIDRQITITSLEDADTINEDDILTFSSLAYGKVNSNIQIIDQVTRGINLSLPTQTNEDSVNQVDMSLRVMPPETQVTLDLTPSDPTIILTDPITLLQVSTVSLTFTQANYNISQKINYTINDQFNNNRSYTITATVQATATIPTAESVSKPTTLIDNDFVAVDLSTLAGQSFNSGLNPSIGILDSNSKFYIAAKDNSNSSRLGVYGCDLAGNTCTILPKTTINNTGINNAGSRPKLSINQNSGNLYITSTDLNNFQSVSWNVNSALTTISHTGTSGAPYLVLDPNTNTLVYNPYPLNLVILNLFLYNIYDILGRNYLHILNSSLSPATTTPIDLETYGTQNFAVGSRGFVYDSVNNNLLYALTVGADIDNNDGTYVSSLYFPMIRKMDLGGSSLVKIKFNKPNAGHTPDLGIDTVNNNMILLTANHNLGGIPYIFICSLTATNSSGCTEQNISAGFASSMYFPKLNIDLVNQKILVLAYNVNTLYLYHCNLDATGCNVTDISKGYSLLTSVDEHNFDSVIDTVNKRLIVVFTEKSTGKLIMIRFGLGGF